MKKAIVLIIFFTILIFSSQGCLQKIKEQKMESNAKKRVDTILKGILRSESGGTVGDEETSVCRYWKDCARITDQDILGRAADSFDEWRKEAGIFPYINSYEVQEVEFDEEEGETVAYVFGLINGSEFIMRVPDKKTITWDQMP